MAWITGELSVPTKERASSAEMEFLPIILFPETAAVTSNTIVHHIISIGYGLCFQLRITDLGRNICKSAGIDPGSRPRASLEHRYWVSKVAGFFEKKGYEVSKEHPIKDNGALDLLAQRPGEQVAVEIETGKSNIKNNLQNIKNVGFDKVIMIATSADAVTVCQKAIDSVRENDSPKIELLSWLDIS